MKSELSSLSGRKNIQQLSVLIRDQSLDIRLSLWIIILFINSICFKLHLSTFMYFCPFLYLYVSILHYLFVFLSLPIRELVWFLSKSITDRICIQNNLSLCFLILFPKISFTSTRDQDSRSWIAGQVKKTRIYFLERHR